MKKYLVEYSTQIEIEANTIEEARLKWMGLSNAELGAAVDEYKIIREAESEHDPRTCENAVPCWDCADAERPREHLK